MSLNPIPSSSAATKSRIMVVDDVMKNLQVVGTMLRNAGYGIMPATSGVQALEGVRVQQPDLILLDLMMPEMDGLEVCRRLKVDASTAQIPVIFLTASSEMDHLVSGFEAGAVDYITKPFNAPELLARVRTHLELKHARQRLREMNDEKNEFMGIAAHDLRSPLNVIMGYSEMMLEDPSLDQAAREKMIDRIRSASKRMVEMIENLLNVNAIERGELLVNASPCDLAALVNTVVETFRPHALAKHQTLNFECETAPVTVLADPLLTVQTIENLVSNAVKYSPLSSKIDVRLKIVGDAGRCEVQDEGPGLSAEDQKKLFGKFARLSAKPTAGEPSIGLGLSIVRKMLEAMKGRVWCISELGRGATFSLELPLHRAPHLSAVNL